MSDAIVEYLFPEIATVALFVVAILGMIALLYISIKW
ncbi:hypothetical protein SAMN04515672_2035 [Natronorubrum texcoconense]|uniref:Uncharacterized protein n=1 Tax=Natronorubrum texcoconense TaxID=1095776 RepID=A0A1G8Y6Z1_9EURY|nr:hypothetical protein SAMN04515672_2035 [Natronorubrum texcoconense]